MMESKEVMKRLGKEFGEIMGEWLGKRNVFEKNSFWGMSLDGRVTLQKIFKSFPLILINISTSLMSDQEDFETGDAGSTDTVPIQAGSIKKGGYAMLKGNPCKVIDYSTAKPGKHGSAKATIVGTDIFTNKKYEDSAPTSANMQQPIVNKVEYEAADVNEDDDFVSLILADGSLKSDIKLPTEDEELYKELKALWVNNNEKAQVFYSIISACGKEKIVSGRIKE